MNTLQLILSAHKIVDEMIAFQEKIPANESLITVGLANEYFQLKRKAQTLEAKMMSAGEDRKLFPAHARLRQTLNKFQRFNHVMCLVVEMSLNGVTQNCERR